MKRIILFFAVCLGLSVFQTTFADNEDAVRAATKRTSSQTVTATNNTASVATRSVASNTRKTEPAQNKNSRSTVKSQTQKVVSRTPTKNVKPRASAQTAQKQQETPVVTRRAVSPTRKTTTARTLNLNKLPINMSNRPTRTTTQNTSKKTSVRAAELNTEKISDIKSADYSKCKTVYYECMDEFCANKDTNLRRCACSSRIHEFDNIQKQLNDAEDKMLDFNQRLLTVSMDKEDAAALNVATEGETAFQIKDRSESEKLLNKITDTLNSSADSKFNNSLSSISLSLDMDSAWDNIDSLSGAATTAKSGVDLYNAARPVCIEMAKEVCSDEELSIAQDGYKLTIQQDCNTVAKSYSSLYNDAMTKIHESSALLDISRLTDHQQRNSDDILTCKKKILEQLYDDSVCGAKLYKCLDMTGEYIDPSTGNAFLSTNLYNLTNLLQEPSADEKWSKLTKNEPFVNFLTTKKEFLKPAVKQCEDISDTVWKDFLDDALSQIKLAQNAKMEEIKQSCTTLVAECKTNALTDLAEFDARALSLFSVPADKTANQMCSDIQTACISLIDTMGSEDWGTGMTGIATNITYDTIMDACAQIGRDCIVRQCNGTSGNFALCKSTTSQNRMDILQRQTCWDEVYNCVKGADNLANMTGGILPITTSASTHDFSNARNNYYTSFYEITSSNDIPELCRGYSNNPVQKKYELTACLIAEQIWGNCTDNSTEPNATILQSDTYSSLMSWFATNTGNTTCNATGCPQGYELDNQHICQLTVDMTTTDCIAVTNRSQFINVAETTTGTITNFCPSGVRDSFRNCCAEGFQDRDNGICVPSAQHHALYITRGTCDTNNDYYCPGNSTNTSDPRILSTYCVTTYTYVEYDATTDSYICNGVWVMVDQYGNYLNLLDDVSHEPMTGAPIMSYLTDSVCNSCNTHNNTSSCGTKCSYTYSRSHNFAHTNWKWLDSHSNECTEVSNSSSSSTSVPVPTSNEFMIIYPTDSRVNQMSSSAAITP